MDQQPQHHSFRDLFGVFFAVRAAGMRITRIRLTEAEAVELERHTGQRAVLFGYPTVVGSWDPR